MFLLRFIYGAALSALCKLGSLTEAYEKKMLKVFVFLFAIVYFVSIFGFVAIEIYNILSMKRGCVGDIE